MVSKKVLEMMKAFVKKYDGVVLKNDDETTFDLENDVVWFDFYQKNIDEGYDEYTDEYVLNIINYWNKYLKNKKMKKCTLEELLWRDMKDREENNGK